MIPYGKTIEGDHTKTKTEEENVGVSLQPFVRAAGLSGFYVPNRWSLALSIEKAPCLFIFRAIFVYSANIVTADGS